MEPEAEKRLILACLRGDQRAWDELFALHYGPVARFVFQLGSDFSAEDVEEICQEVFLRAIRNLSKFEARSRLQTWLFRLASNQSRDYHDRLRAAKRGGQQVILPLDDNAEEGPARQVAGPGAPDMDLMSREDCALVRQAVNALDDPCREVIELKYFADLKYEEIAAELSLNPKTVSSRLSKCLDRFEQVFQGLVNREKSANFSSNC